MVLFELNFVQFILLLMYFYKQQQQQQSLCDSNRFFFCVLFSGVWLIIWNCTFFSLIRRQTIFFKFSFIFLFLAVSFWFLVKSEKFLKTPHTKVMTLSAVKVYFITSFFFFYKNSLWLELCLKLLEFSFSHLKEENLFISNNFPFISQKTDGRGKRAWFHHSPHFSWLSSHHHHHHTSTTT